MSQVAYYSYKGFFFLKLNNMKKHVIYIPQGFFFDP